MPGYCIPSYSPLCSPATLQGSQQQVFFPARFYVMDEFGQIAYLGNAVSETALPITETKKRKHFAIESTPQNLGKLTSETTFGHWKVVFQPLLRTKRAFSQNPLMA